MLSPGYASKHGHLRFLLRLFLPVRLSRLDTVESNYARDRGGRDPQANAARRPVQSEQGSAELVYDNAASGETATFMDGILTTGDPATASFELYPDNDSGATAKKISFVGLITGFEQSSSQGDINTINITFKPSGQITSAI